MKQFVATLFILVSAATTASAQYTERLQEQRQGQGTVTVTQSKEIDDLVNGSPKKPATTTTTTTRTTTTTTRPATTTPRTTKPETTRSETKPAETHSATTERTQTSSTEREERATKPETTRRATTSAAEPAGRKVMRGAKRTKGFRVQVFSGGSKREDRVKAEQIGNRMKSAFPDQPIYTHFYSPRWVCRMGNFKTYQEAMAVCKKVRAMGYKQASVVKGTISVAR